MDRVAPATHTHARRVGLPTIVITALAVLAIGLAARLLPPGARTGTLVAPAAAGDVIVETPAFAGFETPPAGSIEVSSASIVNTTGTPIHVTGASITPTQGSSQSNDPPTFSLIDVSTCVGTVVPAFGYCVLTIEMVAHTSFFFDDNLNVTTSDGGFSGALTRQNQPYYVLSATPENLPQPFRMAFGPTQVGSHSAAQSVTVTDADSDIDAEFDRETGHVTAVSVTGADASDYTVTRPDGCTGQGLTFTPIAGASGQAAPQTCSIDVSDKPGAVGDRPAILDVAYCPEIGVNQIDAAPVGRFTAGDAAGARASAGEPDLCPVGIAFETPEFPLHLLIELDGSGTAAPTTPAPPPPPTFHPTLTTNPTVVEGGRNTQVSGTGFPANSVVVIALRLPGSANVTDPAVLAKCPQAFRVTTNAAGAFTNQTLVVMPNTTPGEYPLEAVCARPGAPTVILTISLLIVPGTAQPPEFVNRN